MGASSYPNGTVLIEPQKHFEKLFVIIKGHVEVKNEDGLIDVYHRYDTFGGIELLKNEASSYFYVVTEELICYEISQAIFTQLCQSNTSFQNYFFSSIVERMDLLNEKKSMHR